MTLRFSFCKINTTDFVTKYNLTGIHDIFFNYILTHVNSFKTFQISNFHIGI